MFGLEDSQCKTSSLIVRRFMDITCEKLTHIVETAMKIFLEIRVSQVIRLKLYKSMVQSS